MREFLKQLLTGRDNATFAIGRVIGTLLTVFMFCELIAEVATVRAGSMEVDTWNSIFEGQSHFVPLMILAIAGLIAGTAFSEPSEKKENVND